MKINEIKHNHSLTDLLKVLLFSILMLLPFIDVAVRCGYVMFNKNAYQSYSGENINQRIDTQMTNINDFNAGYYKFNNNLIPIENTNGTFRVNVHDFETNSFTLNGTPDNLRFYSYPSGNEPTKMYIAIYNDSTMLTSKELHTTSIEFTCYIDSYSYQNESYTYFLDSFYKISYNNDSYLDNVFEYSVSQFVSENDFGQLNFFQWYDELLLSNNSHNALYIHFANWYLNYAMLISLMQILFLVLMWFVNFARKLLDRGMNYDW